MTTIIICVVVFALIFDYINGFHDTANAIATVVSTRVLSPRAAILMAAVLNVVGALIGQHVAKTIASGLIQKGSESEAIVLAAVIAAIIWNLVTWAYGIPSSSSHALIGGLIGAAIYSGGVGIVQWNGVMSKVVYPLIASPLVGFVVAFILMTLIYWMFSHSTTRRVGVIFRGMQILSSATMSVAHGLNDAQKSMGIITMALVAGGVIPTTDVPLWVMLACAITMGLGTAAGGWRIIATVGQKIASLQPVHGFAAETTGAAVIVTASMMGMPISTTHTITSSVLGVGAAKRFSAVRWNVAYNVVLAWVVTLPATALVGAGACAVIKMLGA